MLTLLVLQGPDKGRRFELPDAPTLIGRESRQLPLTDNTVCRRHASCIRNNGEWILKDLGSSNGTYINGMRVDNTYALEARRSDPRRANADGVRRAAGRVARQQWQRLARGRRSGHGRVHHARRAQSNDDSMVLAVPEPAAAAMSNLKIALPARRGAGQQLRHRSGARSRHGPGLRTREGRPRHHPAAGRQDGELVPKVVRMRDERASERQGRHRPPGPKTAGEEDPRVAHDHQSRAFDAAKACCRATRWPTSASAKARAFTTWASARRCACRSRPASSTARGGDEILGVIYIDSSVKNYTYSPDQLRLLTAIGLQAGMAIQNAKLYQQGLQAERMAAIGETTAALSHSIKNILQALRGGADVVEMGFKRQQPRQAKRAGASSIAISRRSTT